MRYLKDEDYSGLIRDEIKDLLLRSEDGGTDEAKLINAENMAVAQIEHYLFNRYEVEAVFAPVPPNEADNRDRYIIMITIDVALYHLYTEHAPERMPQTRSQRYNDVLSDLKDVRRGKMDLNLPRKINDDNETEFGLRISSRYDNENQRW